MTYDLIIFGAGMAGVHCAISAARLDKRCLIVEQTETLGGMATSGLVNPFMRYWLDDNILIEGIFSELLKKTEEIGGTLQNTFDSELFRITLHQMISDEKNIDILYKTIPVSVQRTDDKIQSVTCKTVFAETLVLEAEHFIDTTGNASLAFLAGAETFSGDEEGHNQALTTMFVIGNVNFEKIKDDVKSNRENFLGWVNPNMQLISNAGYFEEIARAEKDGLTFPNSLFFFVQLPGDGRVSVNTTHVPADAKNIFEVSSAVNEGVKQVYQVFDFARKYCVGFEDSYIEKISSQIGIRENRRIKGQYIFTGKDVQNMKKFDDGVVQACYGVDIHEKDAKNAKVDKTSVPQYGDYYEIPLKALISAEIKNLAMAGRCFSSDFIGQSAARIMPTCAGMGQALGTFYGLYNGNLNKFDRDELLSTLKKITH